MQVNPPTELPLRDIHLPEAIGWWPPAIGWWLLLILIPLLLLLIVLLYKKLTRKTPVKTAKRLLIEITNNKDLDATAKLEAISVLLRRTVISHYSREDSASLTGDEWLAFLDQPLEEKSFSTGPGRLLLTGPYQSKPPSETEIMGLIELSKRWLKVLGKQKI